ncbi:DUF418 domain-containing protein [Oceanobacillus sp. 1P07AA]|uniref:DUF418 domain-containing protein n=1 Tax=Oceanobacillus sp. 1P07AA TaxID=3132293 RepID=UPI0039A55DBC
MFVTPQNRKPEIKKRAISLDLARGAILLLIVLAHAPLYLYNADPGLMQRVASTNFFDEIVNLFGIFFIDHRARAMFALLLGYGLVLLFNSQLSKGKSKKDAAKLIRRRSWYLILFGFILAVIIGGQDILMAYGFAGLIVSTLLSRNLKSIVRLFIIITLIYCLATPILWGLGMLEFKSYGFPLDLSATDTYVNRTLSLLATFPIIPIIIHLMIPILPSVLIGIWLAKKQLLTKPELHLRSLKLISVIGLTISILGALPLSLIGSVWHPSFFVSGLLFGLHILTGIAGGLAYAAIFGLIGAKLKEPGPISNSLKALGKRSLTFYIWNEAMLVLFLSPVALDLAGTVNNGIAALIAVGIWMFSILMATLLEKNNMNGPLEIVMRRMMYKNA